MWLLLFLLTALVMVLPMAPALREWRHPSDASPLHIDNEDALDPFFLARDFTARLSAAIAGGQRHLGPKAIALVPKTGDWPLSAAEASQGCSSRIWHCSGSAVLPAGVRFLAEVAARDGLRSADAGTCHALWTGGRLQVGAQSTVLRWAHGQEVDVGAGCHLAGRVSADRVITLSGDSTFSLLHAPLVQFEPAMPRPSARLLPRLADAESTLPRHVRWDPTAGRGSSDETILVEGRRGWRGDLVSRGDIVLGARCRVEGSLKARGSIRIEAGCVVGGSLVAEGAIELGPDTAVLGSVVSERSVVLGAGCVVGAPGRPATVAAPNIDVGPSVLVHGTLWAGGCGRCASVAAAPEAQHKIERAPQVERAA